jgi:hypothetical protein
MGGDMNGESPTVGMDGTEGLAVGAGHEMDMEGGGAEEHHHHHHIAQDEEELYH